MTSKNKKILAGGFTLVETLAAILLLSIALAGPMVIAQKGLQASLIAKDQDTAFNLAQDAVEYIRFARDSHCLTANNPAGCPAASWLTGAGGPSLANCISTDGSATCTLDDFAGSAAAACSGACSPINYDTSRNQYTYTAAGGNVISTSYTRTISIRYNASCSGACNKDEASTTVTVSWNDPQPHSIQVQETLYDWQ